MMCKDRWSQTYIAAIAVTALALTGLSTLFWPVTLAGDMVWLPIMLALLVALAGRYPFKVSPQGSATLVTVPLFAAILLLHPLTALLVAVSGTVVSERVLKTRLTVTAYNTAANGLGYFCDRLGHKRGFGALGRHGARPLST